MKLNNLKKAREILTKEFNLQEQGTNNFSLLCHVIGNLNTLIKNIETNKLDNCNNCGLEIKGNHKCVELKTI